MQPFKVVDLILAGVCCVVMVALVLSRNPNTFAAVEDRIQLLRSRQMLLDDALHNITDDVASLFAKMEASELSLRASLDSSTKSRVKYETKARSAVKEVLQKVSGDLQAIVSEAEEVKRKILKG